MFYCTQKYTQDKRCSAAVITVTHLRNLNTPNLQALNCCFFSISTKHNVGLAGHPAEHILQALPDKRHEEISSVQRSSVRRKTWLGSSENYVCTHTHTYAKIWGICCIWSPNSAMMSNLKVNLPVSVRTQPHVPCPQPLLTQLTSPFGLL